VWETGEVHAEIWWRALRERGHMVDLCVYMRMILKSNCMEVGWRGMDWIGTA